MNTPTELGDFEFKGILAGDQYVGDVTFSDWTRAEVFFNKESQRLNARADGNSDWIERFNGEWRHVKQTKTEASIPALSGIEALVWADIAARQRVGIAKCGTALANNPAGRLERLRHIYEEYLYQAAYLKWEIERTKEEMK